MTDPADATQILVELTGGNRTAVDRLFPLVYDELKRLAQSYLRAERPDHTLQATALVHEAYVRLVNQPQVTWQNRAHFFAISSRAIRQVLVDHARSRGRIKRWGGQKKLSLDEALTVAGESEDFDILALSMAMEKLGEGHPEKEQVVEMRFFGGLTNREVAEVLGVTDRSVERYWRFGRAWLYRELEGEKALPDEGGAT